MSDDVVDKVSASNKDGFIVQFLNEDDYSLFTEVEFSKQEYEFFVKGSAERGISLEDYILECVTKGLDLIENDHSVD